MCDGIVIDAHVMRNFNSELIDKNGTIYSLVFWITNNCGIAICDSILTHWEQHCGSRAKSPLFWEWYFDELYNKRNIHFIKVTRLEGTVWMNFRRKFNIPHDLFIRAIIECANSTSEPRYILTEDMYLYDAIAKSSDTHNQENIRENRYGPICRYLESTYHIIAGTPKHCEDYFMIAQEICQNKSSNHGDSCPRVSMN